MHRQISGICLGTDVIVGFPGETDAHFEETYQLLLDLPLAYFHVFSYSERPWAKSNAFDEQISKDVIEERSRGESRRRRGGRASNRGPGRGRP